MIETKSNAPNYSFEGEWSFVKDLIKASENADAVVILTEWTEYFNLNWKLISKNMRQPAWIFDARSVLKEEKVRDCNLNVWRIGDGSKN